MKVLTLNDSLLDRHASRLAEIVERSLPSGGYGALVGVRRGGSFVCDAFCRHLPPSAYGLRCDVSLQRPSTGRKNGAVAKLLKRLPTFLLDLLRMAESRFLARRHRHKAPAPVPSVDLPEGLRLVLENEDKPRILVIDDAIDSGDTLFAVIDSLKRVNPGAEVKVAVVTVTTPDPRVKADFTLYDNRTLIRFPWSNDYKAPTVIKTKNQ